MENYDLWGKQRKKSALLGRFLSREGKPGPSG